MAMSANEPSPRFLLFSEAQPAAGSASNSRRGRWRFVLEALDGAERLEAADEEPGEAGPRLELLAVVRGLEALDQPSRVTLVTASSYVSRGIRHGLAQWRENDWMWERYGKMTPVKDSDLWRRIDHALQFHQVECRIWRFASEPASASAGEPVETVHRRRGWNRWRRRLTAVLDRLLHAAKGMLGPQPMAPSAAGR
jgi:ribonuclease HI